MQYYLTKGHHDGEIIMYKRNKSGIVEAYTKTEFEEPLVKHLTLPYSEFRRRWKACIDSGDFVEEFKFEDGILHTECFSFSEREAQYSFETSDYEIALSLYQDEVFKAILDSLLKDYAEVSEKTKENIKNLKPNIRKIGTYLNAIEAYFKNGNLGQRDESFISELYDYIINNREGLRDFFGKEIMKIRHPFRSFFGKENFMATMVLSFICSLISLFFSMFLVFMDDWILVKISAGCAALSLGGFFGGGFALNNNFVNDSFDKLYSELVDAVGKEKEKAENLSVTLDEKDLTQDAFLRCIKKASSYMDKHREADFSCEAQAMYRLVQDYKKALKKESGVDRFQFLSMLTKLELSIYSKSASDSMKYASVKEYMEQGLEDRLEFLGLLKIANIKDGSLEMVYNTIKRVLSFPYDGCEREIVELFQIAKDYVEEMQGTEPSSTFGCTPASEKMLRRVSQVEQRIVEGINRFIDHTNLTEDLAAIQSALTTAGIEAPTEESSHEPGTGTPMQM